MLTMAQDYLPDSLFASLDVKSSPAVVHGGSLVEDGRTALYRVRPMARHAWYPWCLCDPVRVEDVG